jgi:nitroimidazol reductase NimA-like FMN-containing flavoprotein (pyridoxamine 5'-phosphate oxidase superfamily)
MAEAEAWLEELPYDECLDLLRQASIGRIAVVVDGFPVVLPVNYRLVETSGRTWVAIRTRPGNVLDQASHVAFETDIIDPAHRQDWSVLVRGTLHHVDPDAADFRARFDPNHGIAAERGRQARDRTVFDHRPPTPRRRTRVAFHPTAYL